MAELIIHPISRAPQPVGDAFGDGEALLDDEVEEKRCGCFGVDEVVPSRGGFCCGVKEEAELFVPTSPPKALALPTAPSRSAFFTDNERLACEFTEDE